MGLCGSNIFGLTMKILIILFILCSAFIAYEPAGLTAIHRPEKVTAAAAVQTASNTGGAGTTISVTVSSTTVGNLVVISFLIWKSGGPAPTISSVSDNGSNTYTSSATPQNIVSNDLWLYQYYSKHTTTATSITVTTTGSNDSYQVLANEYSGVDASVFDDSGTGTGTGTSLSVSGLSPSANGKIIVASAATAATGSWTAGSGYTLYGNNNVAGIYRLAMEYKLVGTTSETAPITFSSSGDWVEIASSFNVAASTNVNSFFLFFKP